eukprot:CAMPEP_0206411906 /NCGR_PEP_ID=MMETSP0294-20121207/33618_1 /ASSEMBLY_ACC=CAM_ASM_000327 /TAXON_ID=39354 /ORGANISM="Heterosigma akashiwo, Strain CCMP2393" /LENGTH=50 /DNA_ID=CAMNT_0053872835 /DNA_START=42 /DNA_END=191 /DNA_ORIENTATION=-
MTGPDDRDLERSRLIAEGRDQPTGSKENRSRGILPFPGNLATGLRGKLKR